MSIGFPLEKDGNVFHSHLQHGKVGGKRDFFQFVFGVSNTPAHVQ